MLAPNLQWILNEFPNLQNINLIALGGQKLVLSATHPTDGDVVLKLINPLQDVEETRREILAVNQIASNRVPAILEVGLVNSPMGDLLWIREQRVPGSSLRDRLAKGPLAIAELFNLGIHILEVLAAAENAHIVHRDIKPENIMIDANGDFWLLDFGISRHLAMTPITPATRPFGKFTLGYAPPEQVRNLQTEIDSTADLFAFGVTFYESAVGINPFRSGAGNDLEILRRVDNDRLPELLLPIRENRSLADLIAAVTQKRRDHRPRTVYQVLDWMSKIVNSQNNP